VKEEADKNAPIVERGAREAACAGAAHGVACGAQHDASKQVLVHAHCDAKVRREDGWLRVRPKVGAAGARTVCGQDAAHD
jgi:hypothetical protein